MKKTIYTIITVLILNSSIIVSNSEAQWIRQNSGTTTNFSDVQFINRYTGWVCGENKILKTTDGGINWIMQSNPSQSFIEQIWPVDSNIVYAAGWFTMLKTTNGGENWNAIFAGTYGSGLPQLEGVHFIDAKTGWFCGNKKMIKTTDGCNTLDTIPINGYMHDIYFRNEMEGVSCGQFVMFKTTNGGSNWYQVTMPGGGSQYLYYRLSFINNNTGWIEGGTNRVFKTTDFGTNWDTVSRIYGADIMYCLRFSNPNIGYSGGTFGNLFKTTNGGFNWKQENIANLSPGYTLSIWTYDDSIVWAVGGGGMILHTTTGGEPLTFISHQTENFSDDYEIYQNYPNPFNSSTNLEFVIIKKGYYKLEIFDITGKVINIIYSGQLDAGKYRIPFFSKDLSSGIYFYRLAGEKNSRVKRMVIIK